MLAFLDLPKTIRILRVEGVGDAVIRTPLGRISKVSLAIELPLTDQLSEEETVEVQKIIDGYLEVDLLRHRSSVLGLPVMLREVMEYFESGATDVEKSFVVSALTEAMRRMRKADRILAKG